MSSSSSSSSSSPSERDDHNGIDVAGPSTRRPRRAPGGGSGGVGRSRGRGRGRDRGVGGGDSEGPSSSRRRRNNAVWPEPIVETLAVQVAIDAARSFGRLAAAAALANVFQVCSTWRAISRSDLLWNRIARRIWGRTHLRQDTWREEYIYWHRTAANFRSGRSSHAVLHFDPSDPPGGDPDALVCRCISLSDTHLACGYADGAVRLFDLFTHRHVRTFRPLPRNFLGRFSRAVTGIILPSLNGHRHHHPHSRLVFGTLDGDIHVAAIDGPPTPRLAYEGQVVNDGALVDFTGCGRWWIGLYAGAPGRSFRVWDGNTENVLYTEGTLTDLESRTGWEMLIELTHVVGRVRVTSQESAMACTRSRAIAFDPRSGPNQGNVEYEDGLVVTSFDVSDSAYVIVNSSGLARVRRVGVLEDVCSFSVRRGAWQRGLMGCMNRGYALMCAGGVIRVWEIEVGQYLYGFAEVIDEVNALVADERHVVASSVDGTLHIWDFGAQ